MSSQWYLISVSAMVDSNAWWLSVLEMCEWCCLSIICGHFSCVMAVGRLEWLLFWRSSIGSNGIFDILVMYNATRIKIKFVYAVLQLRYLLTLHPTMPEVTDDLKSRFICSSSEVFLPLWRLKSWLLSSILSWWIYGSRRLPILLWVDPAVMLDKAMPVGHYEMSQKNRTFIPFVLAVPKGAPGGPNLNRTRHHVYSFSRAKRRT